MNYRSEKSLGLGNTRKVGHFADGDLFCLKPTELVLSTAQHPNHGMPRSFKGPVKLRVMLQARGMEGRSPALTVIIEWNGIWENEKDRRDLMPNHCKAYLYRPTSG